MLTIRLVRTGKKNAPSYRVVLIEKTAPPKSGKFLELLGSYNPRLKQISLKKERIEYWLSQGVQTSDTVHNLLVSQGVIDKPKIKKKLKTKKKKGKAPEGEETKEETPKEDEAKEEKPEEVKEEEKEEKKEEASEEPKKEKEAPKEDLDKKEEKK